MSQTTGGTCVCSKRKAARILKEAGCVVKESPQDGHKHVVFWDRFQKKRLSFSGPNLAVVFGSVVDHLHGQLQLSES